MKGKDLATTLHRNTESECSSSFSESAETEGLCPALYTKHHKNSVEEYRSFRNKVIQFYDERLEHLVIVDAEKTSR